MNNLTFVIDDDGIGVATLDMPGRPFNVFSDDMIDELVALTELIEGHRDLKGVVVTSGKEAFMAGADLAMVRGFTTQRLHATPQEVRRTFSRLSYALRRFERLPVVTVAAINGLALGGGLELAMACHHRVAADLATPCLGLPEVLLGLFPGAGGTQRLPRLTGPEFAARMLLDGAPVTPAVAHAAGLVDHLAAPAQLLDSARAIALNARPGARWDQAGWQPPVDAAGILSGPGGMQETIALAWMGAPVAHLYPAVAAICRCLLDGYHEPIDTAIETEIDHFLGIMLDPVAGNMVRTSFLSKTAAPKRAARIVGGSEGGVRRVMMNGPVPLRVERRLQVVDTLADADAVIVTQATRDPEFRAEYSIALREVPQDTPSDCAVEMRYVGDFNTAEAVELAAAPGELAAQALALANRLRLVPVAAARAGPGASERLVVAVREAARKFAPDPTQRAAQAVALDLGKLYRLAGLEVGQARGFNAAARDAGLAVMGEVAQVAALCLTDGTLQSAEDVDVLAVIGLGFPTWSGGPLSYLDMLRRGEVEGASVPDGAGTDLFYRE